MRDCLTPGTIYETSFNWDIVRGMVITLVIKPPPEYEDRLRDLYNSAGHQRLDMLRDTIHDAIEPQLAEMIYL